MFKINDTVSYGTEGICKITEVTEKNFGGKLTEYYVLKPVYNDAATIFVPKQNKTLTQKMRRMLSPEEIYQMIHMLPKESLIWIEDEHERKNKYKEILARGDRKELVKLLKTLYLHQQEQQEKGKKLHMADERFFKEAEKLIYDEFALVLHIKREEVLPFILEQIQIEGQNAR